MPRARTDLHTYGIGPRIARLRDARHMNQAQLGARVGCSYSRISQIENDYPNALTSAMLEKIAGQLGVMAQQLMSGELPEIAAPEVSWDMLKALHDQLGAILRKHPGGLDKPHSVHFVARRSLRTLAGARS